MTHVLPSAPSHHPEFRSMALRRWDRRLAGVAAWLVLLLCVPAAAWWLTPRRATPLVVVDKTVPHADYREHAALAWWLDHRRRGTAEGAPFDPARDYLGHDPVADQDAYLTDAALRGAGLVYLADAYGIYSGDFPATRGARPGRALAPDSAVRAALEHSDLLYGGVNVGEAEALARFSHAGGAVVAEFNTLETPTWGTPAEAVLAGIVGARYEGWLGRWYRQLESPDEIPRWMRERYRRRTGRAWAFRGEGVVLFGETDDRLAVITADHFTGDAPVTVEVDRADDPLVAGVRGGTPHWYWFAGVRPDAGGVVLASYALHVDSAATALLARERFPARFPAVVRRPGRPLGAYLAGDFADVGDRLPALRRTRFLGPLRRRLARLTAERGRADEELWNVTMPIWDAMLTESVRDR